MSYQLVCGIETHIELATKTKIFCGCTTQFGGEPNTHCCPVCTGQPGALPVLNKKVIEFAVRAGLAVRCDINNNSHMDRKNYVYPDLPKAYQISQFDEPVCVNGYVELDSGKKIRIERIHIEEDAGKLVHDGGYTYVDYNRGGVPLIEIVSMADISSPEEAKEYAEKLQLIMRNIGVSDCKMQEGSMRCDVNVSIHQPGEPWGTRTEIKNINSLSNIVRAMELEMERQEDILDSGEKIIQSTMRYDANSDTVYVLRTKENADDYRYFPEPDILRFYISPEMVEDIRASLPELPDAKLKRYVGEMGLPENNARLIYKYRNVTKFFDDAVNAGASAGNVLNMIIGTIYATLQTEEDKENFEIKTTAKQLAALVKLIDEKKIRANKAKDVLAQMLESGADVTEYIKAEDLAGLSDDDLRAFCQGAIDANPKAVEDIKNGKDKAINVMFGYVMKNSRGKADVTKAEAIIRELIG
ncbi:MAG: Asp-tRNA(Asn)/Glu-tRNA(Gln) amidotransferase subunit GatB [Eubacterium sp.]|nr:Asp-tRNA(Asn)/Glu-tRNA(Gln) amidotransferase subunit GatB [Eubacterium sp.]MDE6155923.1 Asp-tRNA(Asn)/Glu-tRNA(Gln) amidotransferase subunit GatB [Eubacterium sp.]MDE6767247.1 Asp-tRNA(Asn)/Glu-tRNA(Gln) amidotransferase subunit GatB [Eubacterium sp.]